MLKTSIFMPTAYPSNSRTMHYESTPSIYVPKYFWYALELTPKFL